MPTATEPLELRGYQADALDKIAEAEARGVRRQLVMAATGLGKTIIFTALARQRGGRCLVLAHRDELIGQAWEKVREVWPGVNVGVMKGPRNELHAHVVCASVQTLSRPNRLGQLLAACDGSTLLGQVAPFDLVVIDEAHHGTADSYGRILRALDAGNPNGPLLVGVTATPKRADGKGLDALFDEVVVAYDIMFGIRAGYLSDLRGLAVELEHFKTTDIKTTAGDYNAGEAGRLMEAAQAPRAVVKAWQEHAADRRTLVFCPTVAMAEHTAAEFVGAGVAAACVHGGTDQWERSAMLSDFEDGTIQVMVNCAVLTEGYDNPRVDCVVIARPTKSQGLYVQMVGRGTRRHPAKADCLVLDLVGASDDNTLVTLPSLFGLEKHYRERAHGGADLVSGLAEEQHEEQKRLGKLTAREVELFEAVRSEGFAWVATHAPGGRQRYVRPLDGDDRRTVVLAEQADGWVAGVMLPDGRRRALVRGMTQELAQGVAEDYIRANMRRLDIARLDAPWRKRPPTERQRRAAKRWRITIDPSWTAGRVADELDKRIAKANQAKAARQAGKAATR